MRVCELFVIATKSAPPVSPLTVLSLTASSRAVPHLSHLTSVSVP